MTAQLAAMGCPSFVVGILETTTGKIMHRQWSRDEVLQRPGWLKHMNGKGNHIYVRAKNRPAGYSRCDPAATGR